MSRRRPARVSAEAVAGGVGGEIGAGGGFRQATVRRGGRAVIGHDAPARRNPGVARARGHRRLRHGGEGLHARTQGERGRVQPGLRAGHAGARERGTEQQERADLHGIHPGQAADNLHFEFTTQRRGVLPALGLQLINVSLRMDHKEGAYKVRDLSLAEEGRLLIEWAESRMPVLMKLRNEYSQTQPFKGYKITGCLHVTKETAVLIETLQACGAEVAWSRLQPALDQRRRLGGARPERHRDLRLVRPEHRRLLLVHRPHD